MLDRRLHPSRVELLEVLRDEGPMTSEDVARYLTLRTGQRITARMVRPRMTRAHHDRHVAVASIAVAWSWEITPTGLRDLEAMSECPTPAEARRRYAEWRRGEYRRDAMSRYQRGERCGMGGAGPDHPWRRQVTTANTVRLAHERYRQKQNRRGETA